MRLVPQTPTLSARRASLDVTAVGPWLVFVVTLVWLWRTSLFNLPAYGDVLEVVWGILWYHESLFVTHTSPLFNPFVFAPNGWYTATLAYTPTLFLALQPLYLLGGAAFAYNVMALLSFPVAFGGALRLSRLYTPVFPALCAAVFYTFLWTRWMRASAHLNILWLTSLLPWLVWGLERLHRAADRAEQRRLVLVCGVLWGVMLHFSLYAIFLGGVTFAIWGRDLLRRPRLQMAALTAGLALLVGSPIILLYLAATRHAQTAPPTLAQLADYGASLNSLFLPSIRHPSALVRAWTGPLYSGVGGEAATTNVGAVTTLLALLGLLQRRGPASRARVFALSAVGLILALGPLLKWNGQPISTALVAPLDQGLWAVGHGLRPTLFPEAQPPAPFDQAIPLPAFALSTFIPFLESARVMARYAFVGALGLGVLAALGLQRLPRLAQGVLALAWLLETLPFTTANVPWPAQLHPAYAWLAQQPRAEAWSMIDLKWPTVVMNGGEVALASYQTRIPSASSAGSYWPTGTWFLYRTLGHLPRLTDPDTAYILQQWGIRYVFVHRQSREDSQVWDGLIRNPTLRPVQCFEPATTVTPWPYPICVAEVLPPTSAVTNLALGEGWSRLEEWGVWAEGQTSQARWVATAEQDHELSIAAFPHCAPDRRQSLHIEVNGQPLADHEWQTCDTWRATIPIPAASVNVGWNDLRFEYGYAASPFDLTAGANGDRRALAVGFSTLRIEKDE